jgi:glycosyltransferase involved in cell wall biosynthesis
MKIICTNSKLYKKQDINQCQIAILIPAFNEERTIENLIIDLNKELPSALICVIDNNSTDNTISQAKLAFSRICGNYILICEQRRGKANAIKAGLNYVKSDIYVMLDADGTYPVNSLKLMIEKFINDDLDMLVGNRMDGKNYNDSKSRRFHSLGNTIITKSINKLFATNLKDVLSGYRIFNKKLVEGWNIKSKEFELEIEMTMHCLIKNYNIEEFPIKYFPRHINSESKLRTYRDGYKIYSKLLNVYRLSNPLKFYSMVSVFVFLTGIISGLPVIIEFIQTSYITHLPLAVLAVGLCLTSILIIIIGLIIEGANNNSI